MERQNIVSFIGSCSSTEQADFWILKYASIQRFKTQILIITFDKALMKDLMLLNQALSANIHPIGVMKIDHRGEFCIESSLRHRRIQQACKLPLLIQKRGRWEILCIFSEYSTAKGYDSFT